MFNRAEASTSPVRNAAEEMVHLSSVGDGLVELSPHDFAVTAVSTRQKTPKPLRSMSQIGVTPAIRREEDVRSANLRAITAPGGVPEGIVLTVESHPFYWGLRSGALSFGAVKLALISAGCDYELAASYTRVDPKDAAKRDKHVLGSGGMLMKCRITDGVMVPTLTDEAPKLTGAIPPGVPGFPHTLEDAELTSPWVDATVKGLGVGMALLLSRKPQIKQKLLDRTTN